MKPTKRLGAFLFAAAFTAATLTGCTGGSSDGSSSGGGSSAGGGHEIGYVNLADTDVFCMSREAALTAAIEGSDYTVSFSDGNNDNQKQIDQVNAFISRGVDALVIVPADSEAIVPAINAAESAGIPVICLGIAASSGNFTYIGSQNYDAGYMQGEYMADVLPEGANILYCAGTAGLQHSAERREGFLAALEEKGRSDISVLADQDGDYVKDEAMRICDAWIQTYSDGAGGVTFQAIVCANDQMALGCMESLKGAGIPDGAVLISGVDGTDEAIAAVAAGTLAQTILQDAPGQGSACFEAIQKLVAGESVDPEIIVPFQSIIADNVADYQ